MAYATDLQQVIQYLKQGGKLKPPAKAAGARSQAPQPTPGPFAQPTSGAAKPKGRMPDSAPPKMSK